jgi:hypothetical protein
MTQWKKSRLLQFVFCRRDQQTVHECGGAENGAADLRSRENRDTCFDDYLNERRMKSRGDLRRSDPSLSVASNRANQLARIETESGPSPATAMMS